jgi:hypothetical protein
LSIARELKLPDPNDDQLHEFIKTRCFFVDEKDKQFKPSLYNEYLKEWKMDFSLRSLLEEDYKIEKIWNIMQGVACSLPKESEFEFKSLRAKYTLDYIAVKNEEKEPQEVSDADTLEFFEKHKEDYRVPKQADVALLMFDAGNYEEHAPNPSVEDLKAYFEQHKADFAKNDKEAEFLTVKAEVKKAWMLRKCLELAEGAASNLAVQVYDQSIEINSEAWKNLLEKNRVRCIYSIPPYSRASVPQKDELPKELFLKAFELSEERFLSDPQIVKDGVALIALNKFIPTHLPELKHVKEHVINDLKRFHKQKLFTAKVEKIKASLDKEVTPSKEFEVKHIEPFSVDRLDFAVLMKLLNIGSIFDFMNNLSSFQPKRWSKAYEGNGDSLIFFYCRDKEVADVADSDEFKQYDETFLKRKGRMQAELIGQEILTAAFQEQK